LPFSYRLLLHDHIFIRGKMGHLISTLLPCFLITGAAANPLIHPQTGNQITRHVQGGAAHVEGATDAHEQGNAAGRNTDGGNH
jgi:hypothetical protein